MLDLNRLVKDRRTAKITDKAIQECDLDWELPARPTHDNKKRGKQVGAEQKELRIASQTWARQEPAPREPITRLVWPKDADLNDERHPFQTGGPFPEDDAGEYYLDGEMRRNVLGGESASQRSTWTLGSIIGKHSNVDNILVFAEDKEDLDWAFEAGIMPPPHEVLTVICQPSFLDTTIIANGVESVTGSRKRNKKAVGGSMNMAFMWLTFVQDFLPNIPGAEGSSAFGKDLVTQFNMVFETTSFYKTINKTPLSEYLEDWDDFNYASESSFKATMKLYDLSRVKFKVIVSIPGVHHGASSERVGSGRLQRVLEEEGWMPREESRMTMAYKSSTLGKYRLAWLKNFYGKCAGLSKDDVPPDFHLRILYPTVKSIPDGHTNAELCCMCSCFGFNHVTRPLFRDVKPKRPNLINAKTISAVFEDITPVDVLPSGSSAPTRPPGSASGWMYVGTHSLYASAWGIYWQKAMGGGIKETRAKIFNFDMGIVFPLSSNPKVAAYQAQNVVPFQLPGGEYGEDDIPFVR
ncbi:hypothetical protein L198_03085 [Cryptococcus wingfieldii CBS 7118]|uniref:Uncharacterized protein n=1 Tax=Cryptococcus wingfieldii CBS 7118 TaxID=1295528 RepID=A0A1E3JIS9_9TREE|nr:hypothetical protein L198_03085 [Cryptococcus wingfieldii CBS 7118]ODO00758.1 hypothetical protein L198_03085 [Cryptococcus wingfieldii CBS 7118]